MRWLRRLWKKSLSEKRLESELQFHLEQQIADYAASGMSPAEARRRACIEFGGLERFKEECREARWENHLEILARDFRFALRGLAKDRHFAFIAIFALALGIGASTAIFSVVDNALLEPFPYKDSRHLVTIRVHDKDQSDRWRGAFLFPEFQELMSQNHVFDGMVANLTDDIVYAAGDGNLRLAGNYVTPGTFEFFGVPPFLGRSLEAADYQPGAPPVFVLRHAATADFPKWWGRLDVGLAFVLAILALVIMALAEGKMNKQAVDATYRAYRILIHGIFVTLVVFFLAGEHIIWINCLTGFAWRAWLLAYCLPAWFTAFGSSTPS
jgi:hypothetical protein